MTPTPLRRRRAAGLPALFAGALFVFAAPAQAEDFEWPRLLVIGTPGTASGSFASTNGWAPVLQESTGATVRVVPEDNEPQRFRRLNDRKDIQISSVSAAEMRSQTEGIGGYAAIPAVPQRILWHHNDTPWGYVVAGDSDLQSIDDLKRGGVRVAEGMFSPTMQEQVRLSLPAFLGIEADQAPEVIEYVPASSYAENCRSVVEGKVDVAWCATISSVLSEMEGAPGSIRWLDLPPDREEAWQALLETSPMLIPSTIELGVSTARGLESATSNFLYSVNADADEAFAYNMAKWLHESHDDYKGVHPLAARMSLEQFRNYLDRTPMPVHAGTVRYLREIGQWSDADDAWNQAAIDRMDAWVEARNAAIAEARDQRIAPDFNDPEFIAIVEKHTEGLEIFRSRL